MVVVDSSMPLIFLSSTKAGAASPPLPRKTRPLPPPPWQSAQLSAKIAAPCSAVPLPGGKPAPLGSMSMSHSARSVGVIGFPRFGLSPCAPPMARARVHDSDTKIALCVRMGDLPLGVDRPADDGVEMMVLEPQHRGHRGQLAAGRNKLRARGLGIAAFVPGAALQDGCLPVPAPRHAETRKRYAQHRLLNGGLGPAPSAISIDLHAGDPALARIGDARDLVEARPQSPSGGRLRDEGFDFVDEEKLIGLPVRQRCRVDLRFVEAHGRLRQELDAPYILDVHVALVAGQHEAHRITVAGHQRLAVLVECDQGIIHCLRKRYAAHQVRRGGALRGETPGPPGEARPLAERRGVYAGPFCGREKNMQNLHPRLYWLA